MEHSNTSHDLESTPPGPFRSVIRKFLGPTYDRVSQTSSSSPFFSNQETPSPTNASLETSTRLFWNFTRPSPSHQEAPASSPLTLETPTRPIRNFSRPFLSSPLISKSPPTSRPISIEDIVIPNLIPNLLDSDIPLLSIPPIPPTPVRTTSPNFTTPVPKVTFVIFEPASTAYNPLPENPDTFDLSHNPKHWSLIYYGRRSEWRSRLERSLFALISEIPSRLSRSGPTYTVQRLIYALMWTEAIITLDYAEYKRCEVFWKIMREMVTRLIFEVVGEDKGYLGLVRGMGTDERRVLGKFRGVMKGGEIYFTVWKGSVEWARHRKGLEMRGVGFEEELPLLLI